MPSILDRKVVHVLNKHWNPIDKTTVKKAINKTLSGRYQIVGEHWSLFDMTTWIEHWSDAARMARFAAKVDIIQLGNHTMAIPMLVKCTEYGGSQTASDKPVQFTRRNVFLRDRNTCQYCQKKLPSEMLNLDHVIPKSRGGKTNWENLALSCVPCNQKKGSRTPREAGMHLLKEPIQPTRRDLGVIHDGSVTKQKPWEVIMNMMYWNSELAD